MNFKYLGKKTFSIVSCSTRDTSPRDLPMYNDFVQNMRKKHKFYAESYIIHSFQAP